MSKGLAFRVAGQAITDVGLDDLYALKDAASAIQLFAEDHELPVEDWLEQVVMTLHFELKRRGVQPRFAPSWASLEH